MTEISFIAEKLNEIKDELKQCGLWKKQLPEWVNDYASRNIITEQDFAEWLQFVYIPNMVQQQNRSASNTEKYIVPQAKKFFGDDIKKGKLLQLLIELDSLL